MAILVGIQIVNIKCEMKKYLGFVLLFLLVNVGHSQDYRYHRNKTFSYPIEIYFISNDSISSNLEFKWHNSNHDTVQLRKHFNKQFVYPEFCREEEIEGSFYFRVFADSIGKITLVDALRPFISCTYFISKQVQKIM